MLALTSNFGQFCLLFAFCLSVYAVVSSFLAGRLSHRRLVQVIARTAPQAAIDQPGCRLEWSGHACIDHREREPQLPRQNIDRRAAGQIVHHHLRRDRLRKRAHARRRNAVITGEHHDARLREARPLRLKREADADRECFESAQRALRFRARIEPALQVRLGDDARSE